MTHATELALAFLVLFTGLALFSTTEMIVRLLGPELGRYRVSVTFLGLALVLVAYISAASLLQGRSPRTRMVGTVSQTETTATHQGYRYTTNVQSDGGDPLEFDGDDRLPVKAGDRVSVRFVPFSRKILDFRVLTGEQAGYELNIPDQDQPDYWLLFGVGLFSLFALWKWLAPMSKREAYRLEWMRLHPPV